MKRKSEKNGQSIFDPLKKTRTLMASAARLLVASERVPMPTCTDEERRSGGAGGPPPWAAAMKPDAAAKPVDFVVEVTHIFSLRRWIPVVMI